jgi:hypothetical protein
MARFDTVRRIHDERQNKGSIEAREIAIRGRGTKLRAQLQAPLGSWV